MTINVEQQKDSRQETSVTIQEIYGQPSLWLEIYELVRSQKEEILAFMSQVRNRKNLDVIFSGAGSSAFVGEAVLGPFRKITGLDCRAVATTDIVTHPKMWISADRPSLLVSFARSGNSPESVAAFDLAESVGYVRHLIITCNKDGDLAKRAKSSSACHLLVLPERANDRGLAMIGSVTGMILAALLVAQIDKIEDLKEKVEAVVQQANDIIANYKSDLERVASQVKFDRVVCLGSGPKLGIAREAQLKIQELSDGQVLCKFDSYLGFRHGPKAVVNASTLLLYFRSCDPYVAKYEQDLINSIKNEMQCAYTIDVCSNVDEETDLSIKLSESKVSLEDHWNMLPSLIPAQLLAAFKSRSLGLDPDSPSARGAIHRVVQGVTIYPFREGNK